MFVGQPFRDQSHIQIALIATIGSDMAGFDYTFWHLLALGPLGPSPMFEASSCPLLLIGVAISLG